MQDLTENTLTIDGPTLEEIVGLSDRRLRQLARAGFFPEPSGGQYKLLPTFAGVVKHLRALAETAGGTLATERERLTRARRELAEVQLGIAKRDLIPLPDVCARLQNISRTQRDTLRSVLLDQLPAQNAGLDAPKQRENNRAAFEQVCLTFQKFAAEYDASLAAAKDATAGQILTSAP